MPNIGMNIKLLRVNKGITQRHIEKELKKYNGWLYGVESGKVVLFADDVPPLARVLGVDIKDIFAA